MSSFVIFTVGAGEVFHSGGCAGRERHVCLSSVPLTQCDRFIRAYRMLMLCRCASTDDMHPIDSERARSCTASRSMSKYVDKSVSATGEEINMTESRSVHEATKSTLGDAAPSSCQMALSRNWSSVIGAFCVPLAGSCFYRYSTFHCEPRLGGPHRTLLHQGMSYCATSALRSQKWRIVARECLMVYLDTGTLLVAAWKV